MSKKIEAVEESTISEVNINVENEETTNKVADVPETVVYLGPSIPNVVEHGAIFENAAITKALETKIYEKPLLKSLLIPISGLAKARAELQNAESGISKLYAKALN